MVTQVELLTGLVNVAIPEVYQKGMSYYEVLTAVVNKVNELIKQSNEYFSEDVQSVMTKILIGWKDDGTLDSLIADAILNIGDRQYTEQNYVTNGETVTESIDAIDTMVASQLAQTMTDLSQRYVNVRNYDHLVVEGDWKPAIQEAIESVKTGGGVVYLPRGEYSIKSPIVLYSSVTLLGDGIDVSNLVTTENTFNAIELESNARYTTVENMTITSLNGIGETNTGIRLDDLSGGAEQVFRNVHINFFRHGIRCKEYWWFNTVENVRFNRCAYSFYSDSSGGQAINNLFNRCYSNEPTIIGFYIVTAKAWTLLNCNFGGHPTEVTTYIDFISLCKSMKLINCNFESINLNQDLGGIRVRSASNVDFDGCTFVSNTVAAGVTRAFEIYCQNDATVNVFNCTKASQGTEIVDIYAINNSQVVIENSELTNVLSFSTKPPLRVGAILDSARQFTPKAFGVSTVNRGTFINPGTGVMSENIQLTLINSSTVSASVYELQSVGSFKVDFKNISDGTMNTSEHKVAWVVW